MKVSISLFCDTELHLGANSVTLYRQGELASSLVLAVTLGASEFEVGRVQYSELIAKLNTLTNTILLW